MNRFKHFILCVSALSVIGCGEKTEAPDNPENDKSGTVALSADRSIICSDGKDAATFTVTLTAKDGSVTDITDEAEIYFSATDELLTGNRFTTSESGEYAFYAAYGLSLSDEVSISALEIVPEVPSDPQPEGRTFSHRMLLVQHTGATCPNCPLMMTSLKALSENEEYKGTYNLAASHSYNGGSNDKAYSDAAKTVSAMFCSGSYPELTFNLTNTSTGHSYNDICEQVGMHAMASAGVGIAMAVEASGNSVIAAIECKFAEDKSYRIGAWLLEDDIFSTQHGATDNWQHTHSNALRMMHGQKQNERIYGTAVGSVKAGEKVSQVLKFELEEGWKAENCKVLAFVTAADAEGNYDIVNTVVCKAGETAAYDYK